jgi:hypothetical protein
MANPRYDLTELGATGLRRTSTSVYDEFLVQLRAPNGWRLYREMADNDPVIGSILYAIEKVIVRLDWRVEPYDDPENDGDPSDADKEIADFIESCFYDMSESWDSTLSSVLSMLVFGWSYHEIVYKRRVGPDEKDPKKRSKHTDGKIGWRKWPVRSQESWLRWGFDEDGGVQSMTQFDPAGKGTIEIPIDKALLFRTVSLKNNPEGRSLLRNAYRPYYFKKRIEEIEAIGIERDLAGLPVAYVPPEYLSASATPEQSAVLSEIAKIVQNIKRNEQEGVIFPAAYDESGHKVFELQLLSSGGSRQFDTDKVISRYDQRIAMSVLSDFILLGHERVGSFALGTAKMDLWSMAVDAIARNIAETVNQHAIPRLMRLNGMDSSRAPQLNYGDVAHIDLPEIADFVSKLSAAGIIVSDPNLEDYLRELGGLPPAEHNAYSTGAVMPPMGADLMGMPGQQPGQEQMLTFDSEPTTQAPAPAEEEPVEEEEAKPKGRTRKPAK